MFPEAHPILSRVPKVDPIGGLGLLQTGRKRTKTTPGHVVDLVLAAVEIPRMAGEGAGALSRLSHGQVRSVEVHLAHSNGAGRTGPWEGAGRTMERFRMRKMGRWRPRSALWWVGSAVPARGAGRRLTALAQAAKTRGPEIPGG